MTTFLLFITALIKAIFLFFTGQTDYPYISWTPSQIASNEVQVVLMTKEASTTNVYDMLNTSSQANTGSYLVTSTTSNIYVEIGCSHPLGDCRALPLFGPYNVK